MTYGRREPDRQAENNLKKFWLRVLGSSHTQRRFSSRPEAEPMQPAEPRHRPEVRDRVPRQPQVRHCQRKFAGLGSPPRTGNQATPRCRHWQVQRQCSRSFTRTLTVSVNPGGSPEMQVRRLEPDPVTVGPLPMGLRQQPVPNGRRCASPDPPTRLGPRPAPARHRCRKRPRLHHSERSSLPCAHAVEFVVPPPGC